MGWFRKNRKPKLPYLTYPNHYLHTTEQALGNKCDLTLIQADEDGPSIQLVYRWDANLTHEEADRLDTRLRAYVACAIYDAVKTAGLSCEPGDPHGQRPAWHINRESVPISLINAGFDEQRKICYLDIGPVIHFTGRTQDGGIPNTKLIQGFKTQFSNIEV